MRKITKIEPLSLKISLVFVNFKLLRKVFLNDDLLYHNPFFKVIATAKEVFRFLSKKKLSYGNQGSFTEEINPEEL